MRDRFFQFFCSHYSHSTDLFGVFGFGFGFFWAVGDVVTGTQLFTHKKKHVAFGKNMTCCTWKNEAVLPFISHPFFRDMKVDASWIALCSPSAKTLLHTLDGMIYSSMPSVTTWDLVSPVLDICETSTLLKWFVYWNLIL